MRIAAIDRGTNSFHLLVVEDRPDGTPRWPNRPVNQMRFDRTEFPALHGLLFSLTTAERRRLPGLEDRRADLIRAAALLRLAAGLDRGRVQVVEGFDVEAQRSRLRLRVRARGDCELELGATQQQSDLFECRLGRRLELAPATHDEGGTAAVLPGGG